MTIRSCAKLGRWAARWRAALTADAADFREQAKADKRRQRVTVNTGASPTKRAFQDLFGGLARFQLWSSLGWSDIRTQYKRSVLGPLWLTAGAAIFVGSLGILYAELMGREPAEYIPHLTVGYITWQMISRFIESGARVFISADRNIKQLSAPLSVHPYRLAWSTVLMAAHQGVVFFAVAAVFMIMPTWQWLLVIPGLLLIVLNGLWIMIFLGMVSARYRDVPQIVQSVMRVLFFITPVIWIPQTGSRRAMFLHVNPFYHMIELIRAPLLDLPIDPVHWQAVGGMAVLGWTFTFLIFRRFRGRIAYWL